MFEQSEDILEWFSIAKKPETSRQVGEEYAREEDRCLTDEV